MNTTFMVMSEGQVKAVSTELDIAGELAAKVMKKTGDEGVFILEVPNHDVYDEEECKRYDRSETPQEDGRYLWELRE